MYYNLEDWLNYEKKLFLLKQDNIYYVCSIADSYLYTNYTFIDIITSIEQLKSILKAVETEDIEFYYNDTQYKLGTLIKRARITDKNNSVNDESFLMQLKKLSGSEFLKKITKENYQDLVKELKILKDKKFLYDFKIKDFNLFIEKLAFEEMVSTTNSVFARDLNKKFYIKERLLITLYTNSSYNELSLEYISKKDELFIRNKLAKSNFNTKALKKLMEIMYAFSYYINKSILIDYITAKEAPYHFKTFKGLTISDFTMVYNNYQTSLNTYKNSTKAQKKFLEAKIFDLFSCSVKELQDIIKNSIYELKHFKLLKKHHKIFKKLKRII